MGGGNFVESQKTINLQTNDKVMTMKKLSYENLKQTITIAIEGSELESVHFEEL